MLSFLKKGALAVALGASVMTVAAPAQAQRYERYREHRNNDAAVAIGAGVLGLAVGAALASDRRDGYYDRRYDDRRYYRRHYNRGYYDRRYYAGPRYRAYAPRYYYRDRPYRDRYHYDRPHRGYYRNW